MNAALRRWLGEKTTIIGLAISALGISGYLLQVLDWRRTVMVIVFGMVCAIFRENPDTLAAQLAEVLAAVQGAGVAPKAAAITVAASTEPKP